MPLLGLPVGLRLWHRPGPPLPSRRRPLRVGLGLVRRPRPPVRQMGAAQRTPDSLISLTSFRSSSVVGPHFGSGSAPLRLRLGYPLPMARSGLRLRPPARGREAVRRGTEEVNSKLGGPRLFLLPKPHHLFSFLLSLFHTRSCHTSLPVGCKKGWNGDIMTKAGRAPFSLSSLFVKHGTIPTVNTPSSNCHQEVRAFSLLLSFLPLGCIGF